jgi:hypothetical protein
MLALVSRRVAALGLLTSAAACDAALPAPSFTERDSAGVHLVESVRGDWAQGEGWRVSPEPLLQIGVVEGDAAYQFSQVVHARRLADGRMLVADRTSTQLRFFDVAGGFIAAVGGPGDGPGEFGQITDVVPYRGDSILVWDSRARRVTVFDAAGQFARVQTLPMEPPGGTNAQGTGPLRVIVAGGFTGAFADGTLLVRAALRVAVDPGVPFRPEDTLMRITPEGEPLGDPTTFQGPPLVAVPPGTGAPPAPRPFAPTLARVVHGERLYIGTGEKFEIEVRTADGSTERVIRAAHRDLRVTQAHREAYLELLRRRANERRLDQLERLIAETQFPATLPAYAQLLVDAADHLWVLDYPVPGAQGPGTWSVFDPDGRLLGEVQTPEGLLVHQIGRDFLVGVWTDELDVPFVRVYGLERR